LVDARAKEQAMDLEVVIEGVTDAGLEKEIKRQVRKVCKSVPRPGEWSVFVAPSETRGEWDLLVKGPFGSHISSFIEQAEQLPALVAEQLRTCLSAVVNA
jgi:hypothetical protein